MVKFSAYGKRYDTYYLELTDEEFFEFVKTRRAIQLRPPVEEFPHWRIFVTDGGSFSQRG